MSRSYFFKYVQTTKRMATNIRGVFAADDIGGPPWQLAEGEECVAGIDAANQAKKMTAAG